MAQPHLVMMGLAIDIDTDPPPLRRQQAWCVDRPCAIGGEECAVAEQHDAVVIPPSECTHAAGTLRTWRNLASRLDAATAIKPPAKNMPIA